MFSDLQQRVRWQYMALAFVCALALWYTVNAREQVERVVEVRLDYKGLPPGLVITKGQINKISVRLRAPLELLRSLGNREISHTLDISHLTVGSNIIPLYTDDGPVGGLRGYQPLEIMPSRLTLEVDRVLEARVPVEARLRESSLTPSISLKQVQIQPETVTVRGPATEMSKLKKIPVEVPVALNHEGQTVTDDISVVAPPGFEVSPSTVKVTRLMEVQRRTISLQRDVIADTGGDLNLSMSPSRVTLRISVPSVAFKDAAYLSQIQASVEPDSVLERLQSITINNKVEQPAVPVKISLPPGARLISVNPEQVRLSQATQQ